MTTRRWRIREETLAEIDRKRRGVVVMSVPQPFAKGEPPGMPGDTGVAGIGPEANPMIGRTRWC